MQKNYPFAAVLFDLDGVIADTTEMHYRLWDAFARRRGYTPMRAELLGTNGVRAAETMRKWFGPLSDGEIETLTAEQAAYINTVLDSEPLAAIPGAIDYIDSLCRASIPRAVATSARPENAVRYLKNLGLSGKFGALITSADVTQGKPHPGPYLKAAAQLGVSPGQCLVIEDSVSGIQSAKAAGARCLALMTTFPREILAPEKPDWLCQDFRDLPEMLRP
ncbi:MAG TPA: HAD family phosphatase [Planctomycetota bacterium]|nr:HAD family phosphatase [Planctomycetota bacterium]